MVSDNKQSNYAEILDIIEKMKAEVVSSCTAQLMLTGMMPVSAQNELKVLSQITGAVFNGVITLGVEVFEDENNDGLVYTNIGGKKYSCAKINISNSVSISSKPLSASEAYSMTSPVEESSKEEGPSSKKVSIETFQPVEPTPVVEEPVKEEAPFVEESPRQYEEVAEPSVQTPPVEAYEEPSFTKLDESNEFGEDSQDSAYEAPVENKEEPVVQEVPVAEAPTPVVPVTPVYAPVVDNDLVDDDDFEPAPTKTSVPVSSKEELDDLLDDDDFDNVSSSSVSKEEETKEEPSSAEEVSPVISEVTKEEEAAVKDAVVSTFKREGRFEEERSKPIGEMIYSMAKLSLSQIGNGKPEEVIIMIAPLKIPRGACPAIPIVVALYNRGRVICKSSYDMGDGGKALVQVEIGDFHLMCRGSFDDNGKFSAFTTTTGVSSQQGDRVNLISCKSYGNSQDPNTNNGHIKVKYESESGEGTIEVFPFGTEEDDEFIVLVKNPEFCDTYYLSKAGRGGSVAKIFGKDGDLELVPAWNGDVLELEIFEK